MLKKMINIFFPIRQAYAHCDIPCGIYDPHAAQVAAHTVIRMVNLIKELKMEGDADEAKKLFDLKLNRLTAVKEEHAEIVKREVRIIWGDYFKPENLKDFPDLHEKVFKIMKLASKNKQEIDSDAAKDLLTAVQEFAEIFYKSKGLETIRVKTPYPTEGEIVINK